MAAWHRERERFRLHRCFRCSINGIPLFREFKAIGKEEFKMIPDCGLNTWKMELPFTDLENVGEQTGFWRKMGVPLGTSKF